MTTRVKGTALGLSKLWLALTLTALGATAFGVSVL
jgi:hypothetical protein